MTSRARHVLLAEVFNCPYTKDWEWKKKFALRAFKNAGSGTRASQDQVRHVTSHDVTTYHVALRRAVSQLITSCRTPRCLLRLVVSRHVSLAHAQILAEVSELVTWLERQGNKPFDIEEALVQVHANMSLQTLVGKKYARTHEHSHAHTHTHTQSPVHTRAPNRHGTLTERHKRDDLTLKQRDLDPV